MAKRVVIEESNVLDFMRSHKQVYCSVGGYMDVLQSIDVNGYTFANNGKVSFDCPMKLEFSVIVI